MTEPTPTIGSLAPNTGVGGAAAVEVTVTGTNFTPFSVVRTGAAAAPVATQYVSATSLKFIMKLPVMVPGTTTVSVKTGSKVSSSSNFTVT